MPIVSLPAILCSNQNGLKLKTSQTSLQDIFIELIEDPRLSLTKLGLFIKKNEDNLCQVKGLLVCVNNAVITRFDCQLQADDELTFIPAVSGG